VLGDSGIRDRVVLVTGGSRGIGRAIVERFVAEGADVTFFYRDNAAAADAVAGAADRIAAECVDVRDREACSRAVERIVERTGRIDVLVNNSGIVRDGLLAGLGEADLRAMLDTNVVGVFNVTNAVVPHMIAQRSGKIVNLSSSAAARGGRGQTGYAASKGAIEALTRSLAVELAPRNINVNAVAPGLVETDMSRALIATAGERVRSRILLGRFGTPDEIANAVVFLASRHADYITGEVLHVDGGLKME
jgi:3-oxoacyl-[acyl-carrier protein] reductase